MSSYAIPINTAFLSFAFFAFFATVPWTIYQYRKHGYFSFWRSVIFFSFIYYCLTAFFLVSLPLPENRNNIEFKDHVYTQFHPFNMINNFKEIPGFRFNDFKTYPVLIKSFTFLEVFFNVTLLFPLGVYLRYFFKSVKKWYFALIITFCVTLFFEVSQLTAMFGYYTYPYRLFDVDDLLMNTLGGMIGFFVAPLLLYLIPSRDAIQKKDALFTQDNPASYGGQLLELLINTTAASFIGSLFSLLFFKGYYLLWCNTFVAFLFFVFFPFLTKGGTFGGKILKIKMTFSKPNHFMSLLYRFLLVYSAFFISEIGKEINGQLGESGFTSLGQIGLVSITFIIWIVFWSILIIDWLKKKPTPFFNRLSGIRFIRK